MLNLEHLLKVPYVDAAFDLAPDGVRVAYAWNGSGEWEIYETPLDSSSPQLVTRHPGGKFSPKYSPDGSKLAYVVDFDGGESFHLFIKANEKNPNFGMDGRVPAHPYQNSESFAENPETLEISFGEAKDFTNNSEYALQPNFAWSPDSSEIAYLADKSGNFDAYILNIAENSSRLVFANGHPCWNVKWSPDGRWLAIEAEMRGQDSGIFLVALDGSEVRELCLEGKPLNAHHPAFSPDGKRLAFASDERGYYDIAVYDITRDHLTFLTHGGSEDVNPVFSPDGKRVAFVRERGVVSWIEIHGMSGKPRRFEIEEGVHSEPVFTHDGKSIIFTFNNLRRPPDLWKLELESGVFTQLTKSFPSPLTHLPPNGGLPAGEGDKSPLPPRGRAEGEGLIESIPNPQEIRYTGMDGVSIPALLFVPPNAKLPAPAVVMIHGGPNGHYRAAWHPVMAHLASRGFVVLAPNYRGSTGYGRAWQNANYMDLGGVDTHDCAAGAHYLVSAGLAHPEKIAVTGRSHGGYLVFTCLTQFPDLWAAGSGIVPFLNFFTCHENAREDLQHWDIEMMGDPKENYDLWYSRSPFFFLDKVEAPVQLICGEFDPRCPPSESEMTRDKLLELGREVDFALYRGEGHIFLKSENVISSEIRRVEFLAKYLE